MKETSINTEDIVEQEKKKYSAYLRWLTFGFGLLLILSPLIFNCYSCILTDIPFYLRAILLFVSFCWFSALFVCVLNRLLFIGGISNSDLHVIRILGQATMVLVITGVVLILLACIKVLFLL